MNQEQMNTYYERNFCTVTDNPVNELTKVSQIISKGLKDNADNAKFLDTLRHRVSTGRHRIAQLEKICSRLKTPAPKERKVRELEAMITQTAMWEEAAALVTVERNQLWGLLTEIRELTEKC